MRTRNFGSFALRAFQKRSIGLRVPATLWNADKKHGQMDSYQKTKATHPQAGDTPTESSSRRYLRKLDAIRRLRAGTAGGMVTFLGLRTLCRVKGLWGFRVRAVSKSQRRKIDLALKSLPFWITPVFAGPYCESGVRSLGFKTAVSFQSAFALDLMDFSNFSKEVKGFRFDDVRWKTKAFTEFRNLR